MYPDSCVSNNIGSEYNANGCCWIERYCQANIDSIQGMSLTAEFLDEAETELCGHGNTDIIDGLPIFDNATIIGNFERGYITDMEINGVTKRVCVGEGTIDQMRHNNFVQELEKRLAAGDRPDCSVEIVRQPDQEAITYLNGKYETGRVPVLFEYSGLAVLGIVPSDKASVFLELNEKIEPQEEQNMDEIKTMIAEVMAKIDEVNACNKKIEEQNAQIAEQNATVEQLQAALAQVEAEKQDLWNKHDVLYKESEIIKQKMAEAELQAKTGEMNTMLAQYAEDQVAVAKEDVDAFMADPLNTTVEINAVENKILADIGRKAREAAKAAEQVAAEQNAANKSIEDIFSGVDPVEGDTDTNIF